MTTKKKQFIDLILGLIILISIFLVYKLSNINFEKFETNDTNETHKTHENKIAFLFLTYNNLKRPEIWNKFFNIENADNSNKYSNKYTIYNHAKEKDKVTNILLKDKHIPEHIETCWGCPNLVEANILMMKEALKDPLNTKFILISDSCIPIVSFDKFYNKIMKDDKSYINIHYNNNLERYDNIINPQFKKNEFTKHSGSGLILNQKHTKILVSEIENYIRDWKLVTVPDEHYFGNILRVLVPTFNNEVLKEKITFDIWSKDILDNNKIDFNNDIITDSYINIKKITNKAIDELRDKKFVLVRKIDKDTEIDINYITY